MIKKLTLSSQMLKVKTQYILTIFYSSGKNDGYEHIYMHTPSKKMLKNNNANF